jgi:hypothetical protein
MTVNKRGGKRWAAFRPTRELEDLHEVKSGRYKVVLMLMGQPLR